MSKILVVDDDVALAEVIGEWFKAENHSVDLVNTGKEGAYMLRSLPYDVAILDWELPEISGIEICRQFRAGGGRTPILMLTGKRNVDNRVDGLDAGADDYLTKPFEMVELAARVRALLRRPSPFVSELLKVGNLELDPKAFTVKRDGQPVDLLPKEFALLEFLMRNPNQVFSSEAIITRVWPSDTEASPDGVRSYITRLRNKIDVDGQQSHIKTVHRLGYKLEV